MRKKAAKMAALMLTAATRPYSLRGKWTEHWKWWGKTPVAEVMQVLEAVLAESDKNAIKDS